MLRDRAVTRFRSGGRARKQCRDRRRRELGSGHSPAPIPPAPGRLTLPIRSGGPVARPHHPRASASSTLGRLPPRDDHRPHRLRRSPAGGASTAPRWSAPFGRVHGHTAASGRRALTRTASRRSCVMRHDSGRIDVSFMTSWRRCALPLRSSLRRRHGPQRRSAGEPTAPIPTAEPSRSENLVTRGPSMAVMST